MTIDESLLLHKDCSRMLKRPSKISLVNEVTYYLFGSFCESNNNNNNSNSNNNNFEWYKILLFCFGCYKN